MIDKIESCGSLVQRGNKWFIEYYTGGEVEVTCDNIKPNRQHGDLKEAYKAIVSFNRYQEQDYFVCNHCGEYHKSKIVHRPDCIVLKAEKYIKENK